MRPRPLWYLELVLREHVDGDAAKSYNTFAFQLWVRNLRCTIASSSSETTENGSNIWPEHKSGSLAHASRMKQEQQAFLYSQELGLHHCEMQMMSKQWSKAVMNRWSSVKKSPKCWGSVTQCQESDLWSCATFQDPRGVGVNQITPQCKAGRGRPWCPTKVVPSSWRQELPAVDTH